MEAASIPVRSSSKWGLEETARRYSGETASRGLEETMSRSLDSRAMMNRRWGLIGLETCEPSSELLSQHT